jgi:hypothetical protein
MTNTKGERLFPESPGVVPATNRPNNSEISKVYS